MKTIAFAVILGVLACGLARGEADATMCPPGWCEDLVYYQSFDSADGQAEVNRAGLKVGDMLVAGAEGVHGKCGLPSEGHKTVSLGSDSGALSPHRPMTISLWWCLEEDLKPQGGFNLIQLTGRGFISHFARGGPWCGLKDTAGVVQVYNLSGINNVNGIYDQEWRRNVDVRKGQWHHSAMVISAASLVSVYTDGKLVFETRTAGRPFRGEDGFKSLVLGGGVRLDEVMVLSRPLSGEEIAEYVSAMRMMRRAYEAR